MSGAEHLLWLNGRSARWKHDERAVDRAMWPGNRLDIGKHPIGLNLADLNWLVDQLVERRDGSDIGLVDRPDTQTIALN